MKATEYPANGPEQALADLITASRPYTGLFDYDHYPTCFEEFEKAAAPLLADAAPDPGVLLEKLETLRNALPGKEKKNAFLQDKLVLALFLSPVCGKAGGAVSDFAVSLREEWIRRYPREAYLLGDYETIMKGFDANLLGLPLRKSSKR